MMWDLVQGFIGVGRALYGFILDFMECCRFVCSFFIKGSHTVIVIN